MVWEIVQGIGAVVGLLTGLYVLYDYFTREVPTAFIVSRPLIEGSVQNKLALRVANKSERPIICQWKNEQHESDPYTLGIMLDHSVRAGVDTVLPGEAAVVIDGHKAVEFPILMPSGRHEINKDNTLTTEIRWGFVQRRILSITK